MTEEQMLEVLAKLGTELAEKFTKQYSIGRLDQIKAHLDTLKMLVSHVHDEAAREETDERRNAVIQRMVLNNRPLQEAQAAVEAGER